MGLTKEHTYMKYELPIFIVSDHKASSVQVAKGETIIRWGGTYLLQVTTSL